MDLSTQQTLVRKILKNGSINSFELLVSEHTEHMYRIAYRVFGNPHDASDMTQESLIKAYKSLENFKFDSKFSTWLYRITMNTCIDEYRRRNKRSGDVSIDSVFEENLGASNSPHDILEKNETVLMVREAISLLSEEHKRVVILRDIEGMSYAQIAEIEGISEGTVKSRISRARGELRKILEKKRDLF